MEHLIKKSAIEKLFESMGILRKIEQTGAQIPNIEFGDGGYSKFPPSDNWNDWTEYDAESWPRREMRCKPLIESRIFRPLI